MEGNVFHRNDTAAYIILPINTDVTKLEIDFGNIDTDFTVRIYCSDGDGFSNSSYTEKTVSSETSRVVFDIKGTTSKVKIKFLGNLDSDIEIERVLTYKMLYAKSWRLFVTAIIATILCYMVIFLFIKKFPLICNYGKEINLFFMILVGSQIFFLVINFITHSYYWVSYFHTYPVDGFMDHFNMLALLNNEDPYYLNA